MNFIIKADIDLEETNSGYFGLLFFVNFPLSVLCSYCCFNEVADIMKVLRLYFDKSGKQRKSRLGG